MKIIYKSYMVRDHDEMVQELAKLKSTLPNWVRADRAHGFIDRAIEIDISWGLLSPEDRQTIVDIASKYSGLDLSHKLR